MPWRWAIAAATMPGGIDLSPKEIAALRAALGLFESRDRSRGTTYQRRGAVKGLRLMAPERMADAELGFEADVLGSQFYLVDWTYIARTGWQCSCTCPVEFNCKHAYAAAQELLIKCAGGVGEAPVQGFWGQTPRAAADSGELTRLVSLLEQRHRRSLTGAEMGFVARLEDLWSRLTRSGSGGAIFPADLANLGLAQRQSYYYDASPAIRDWWTKPPSSPLELWQYLALYAQRKGLECPALMAPLTDVALVWPQVEARARRQKIQRWTQIFRDVREDLSCSVASTAPPADEPMPEIRLRLAEPKLAWECRAGPTEPWRPARPGQAKRWLACALEKSDAVPPDTLALLQQVRVVHARRREGEFGWSSGNTEPQTLKAEEIATGVLVRWLLGSERLRHCFVNEAGETYDPEPVRLVWSARVSPGNPDDVELRVAMPDGSPVPKVFHFADDRSLGLGGRRVFLFPTPLPGVLTGDAVEIPREALQTVGAARHLRRAGVVLGEGVSLPEIERVEMRPRFVCRVREDLDCGFGAQLQVELQAHARDDRVVQRWNGSAWTSLPGKSLGLAAVATGKVADIDLARAAAVVPLLEQLRLAWTGAASGWTRNMSRNFPDEFVAWVDEVRAAGAEIECDPWLAGLVRPPDRARVEIQVAAADDGRSGIDWFDLQLVVRPEDTTLTREEIALLLKARGRFVLLKGRGWRRLEIDLGEEQAARLADLGLDAGSLGEGAAPQRFHALQLGDERIAGLLPEQHANHVRERVAALRQIEPPPVPSALSAEMRPYQKDGFHFLAHLATNRLGGVLADDMGLGKTIQALVWLLWLAAGRSGETPVRALVVCPKSVVTNWENEARRFAPSLPVAPWRPRGGAVPAAGVVVVNYAQLRLAASELGAIAWDAVILDEGQNIKNPQSQTAQVARDLRATHRLVLTGTPIENRALDLWSLFAFAMPGLLGGQTAFKRAFNDKTDPSARARLARRVRHFMLRRTKAQVAADLPPRIEEDLVVELEPGQRKLYDAELKRTRQMLLGVKTARQFDTQRFNILQSLLRLRQICCDPRLLGAGGDSAKLGALLDLLEPILAEGHKVLVFSQFVTLLELLQAELREREVPFLTITGQTEGRQELVDEFQRSPDVRVFLLSLKAAGSGLNLTAASYVVLFDPWWNPAVEAQAIDRTHRIGQTSQVIAYRLIAKDTVEEKIRALQRSKAELARAIVQEESLATVMNLEDLRYVLG